MNKLVDEAPYHPGYEDAVVPPNRVYMGVKAGKMLWKPKPLSDEEIEQILYSVDWAYDPVSLVRAIEERHGIK